MLQSKSFMKKTRRGQVVKVVREHYLQDDISCGALFCPSCEKETACLGDSAANILIVDTNVTLHHIDLLENNTINDVVVLSVVLEEVKNRNISVYNRVRALCSNPVRRFFVFANEHHKDTYVKGMAVESPNDRNDRAIRSASLWYQNHLARGPPILLLTNDAENKRKALQEGIRSETVQMFVESLGRPELLDLVLQANDSGVVDMDVEDLRLSKKKGIFVEHRPMSEITTGLQQRIFHQDARFVIFVCGRYAHDILGKEIKLPEGAVLLVEQERQKLTLEENTFKTDVYFQKASTSQFGAHLLWSPCVPSSHTLLSQNFHVFPLGTVCVSDSQVSGKGRAGNVWESPKGCLMLSFTLEMENGHMLPFLQYVVSIALIDAIEHVSLQKGLPTLPVKIKWPNDIYANGIKIGGVLCTSTYREKKFNVVVGIGLNVGNKKPTTCLDALLHDLNPDAPGYEREELLAAFFVQFEELFKTFINEGFGPLESSYYRKWLHSGQEVVLEEKQDCNIVEKVPLIIQGLSPTGYLLATNDRMEAYELHPDGNSFDFLKGLVRTKLQV